MLISVNLEALIHGLEAVLGTHFLDAKVYFMSDLPATVEWADVLKISADRVRPVLPVDALSIVARGAHAAGASAATRMTTHDHAESSSSTVQRIWSSTSSRATRASRC